MSCAPDGRWPFPFLRNGDYPTPAFTDSPPCARFARRLAHSHGSLRYRPRWGLARVLPPNHTSINLESLERETHGWAKDAQLMCETLCYANLLGESSIRCLISARAANALMTVD